ncbi:PKD domain-containing protein [Candidatus Parcubacteria bacterium]|nr:PKD domain-containing protein [Candidatus Parcubacteria bacterium]
MESKTGKKLIRQAATFILMISLVFPAAYLPIFAPKAEAIFGVGDINLESIPTIVKYILESLGKTMAKKMVDDMVQSTIRWANTGFDGNPAFVTDPDKYFGNLANGIVGDAIAGSELGFLCSPFQAQIKIALREAYVKQYVPRCTLNQIGVNLDNFYESFDEGGWNAWFHVTQENGNNPYGSYLGAINDIDRKLASAIGVKKDELQNNNGFLSYRECLVREASVPKEDWKQFQDGYLSKAEFTAKYPNFGFRAAPGECIEQGPVKTPGSVIQAQLNSSLGAGLSGLINANDINSLVSAFANGLLQRYVFGPKGLFGDNSSTVSKNEVIDIDGDKLPDGYDYDGDRQLDICHHGLKDPTKPPSNANCIGSKGAVNSPYFSRLCEASSETSVGLEIYQGFLDRNQSWDPNYSRTWLNKTTDAQSVVEGFINAISRYDVQEFDKVANNFALYSKHLGNMIESLVRADDIRNDGLPSNDNITIQQTTKANKERLAYIKSFTNAIGQCSNPDTDAISSIPVPDDVGSPTSPNPSNPSTPEQETDLSCSAPSPNTRVGQTAAWLVSSGFPTGTIYSWSGTDVSGSSSGTNTLFLITYNSAGTKTMSVTAQSGGTQRTAACSNSVNVTSP